MFEDITNIETVANDGLTVNFCAYSKTCVKLPLKNRQNQGLNDKWELNTGQKYCRMPPLGAFCNIFTLY